MYVLVQYMKPPNSIYQKRPLFSTTFDVSSAGNFSVAEEPRSKNNVHPCKNKAKVIFVQNEPDELNADVGAGKAAIGQLI